MVLTDLINKIDSLKLELSSLQPLSIDRQDKLDKKFRLEFNYNSNHIEGNTLTYGETVLFLIFDKTMGEHQGREYEEMRGSDVALKLIQDLANDKERPLTEHFIRNLNEIILVRPYWANAITPDGQQTRRQITPGEYKKYYNSVRLQNGEIFHYASPEETPALMTDLVQWYIGETEKKGLHAVALAALLHYKFVRIHPFDDGNGRISRLLMNYVLYNHGFPPVVIKSANKKDYLFALNRADAGDVNAFVEYIATQMIWSLELCIKAANGEEIEEYEDVEKEIEIWKKELKSKNPIDAITPKSGKAVRNLYAKNWSDFLKRFNEKFFSLFRDLFIGWDVYGLVNRTTKFHIGFAISSVFPQFSEIDSIILAADISGFKNNKKSDIFLSIKIEILLNPDSYTIKTTTPYEVKSYYENGKSYNQTITEEEEQIITNDIIKDVFNFIKEHSEI